MNFSRIFSPTTQTFLPHNLDGRGRGSQRVLLDTNILWHFGEPTYSDHARPIRDRFISHIIDNYDRLIEEPFEAYSEESNCIVENQLTWNMNDETPLRDVSVMEGSLVKTSVAEEERATETDAEDCITFRAEHAAYYCPGHFHDETRYGIHVQAKGVAHLANKVGKKCREPQDREILVLCALYKLYAHERCHGWVEDIATLQDVVAKNLSPVQSRLYATTNRRYNNYIFMEEAVCNTAAFGWLYHFLTDQTYAQQRSVLPQYDGEIILDAFEAVMRRSPRGYRDFVAIKSSPLESGTFIYNFKRLLLQIYDLEPYARRHDLDELLEAFFGGRSHGRVDTPSDWRSHDRSYRDALCSGEPPMHWLEK